MTEMAQGATNRTIQIYIPDPASTDGGGKTGLVAADLIVSYVRTETDNDVTVTDVSTLLSDLAALTDAHADWGWLEISSTLAPGLYRLDVGDAAWATGAWEVTIYVMIEASTAAASPRTFTLTPIDPYDGVNVETVDGEVAVDDEALAALVATAVRTELITELTYLDTPLSDLATAANLAVVDGIVDAIVAKTDNLPAAPAAVGDIPTAAANATAVWGRANTPATGFTPAQALHLSAAGAAAKTTGMHTASGKLRSLEDDRDLATVGLDGNNRTSASYSL